MTTIHMVQMVNSIQAAKFLTQQEADRLTEKIIGLADEDTKPSLNRKTFVYNRVRAVNEEAMRGLDTVYEAIAQDKKITFKYFHYTMGNNNKIYSKIGGSKIITVSPYEVRWTGYNYRILVTRKVHEEIRLDSFELEHMEQIEKSDYKREGAGLAAQCMKFGEYYKKQTAVSFGRNKLKVWHGHVDYVIDKFGKDTIISPMNSKYVIATINEHLTPELYLWMLQFDPRIKIVSPKNAESQFREYFAEIAKGKRALIPGF